MQTTATSTTPDVRRIAIFYGLALAIAGSAALYIGLNGGLTADLPVPGIVILALVYMPAPAVASLLTRAITREGWGDMGLRVHLRRGWPAWLLGWFAPGLLVIAGTVLYFVFFPQHFDAGLAQLRKLMGIGAAAAGAAIPFSPEVVLVLQVVQGLLIAPVVNALPTLGEELGWRAYLQPKLMGLGWRRAMLLMGIFWGVWHWPVLALGYNYGFDYPGAPWLGMVVFVVYLCHRDLLWLADGARGECLAFGHRPRCAQRDGELAVAAHDGSAQLPRRPHGGRAVGRRALCAGRGLVLAEPAFAAAVGCEKRVCDFVRRVYN